MKVSTYLKAFLTWNALCLCLGDTFLKATIHMHSILVNVTMFQKADEQDIHVSVESERWQMPYWIFWKISKYWVDYTIPTCEFDNFLANRLQEKFTIPRRSGLRLGDFLGHSFMIYNSDVRVCATLQPCVSEYTTLHVKMNGRNISGDVWFRQAALHHKTEVVTDLFNPNQVAKKQHIKWKIYEGSLEDCHTLQPSDIYDPVSIFSCKDCDLLVIGSSLGQTVVVGTSLGSQKAMNLRTNAPLTGANSIKGKLLVFFERIGSFDYNVTACGQIRSVSKKATAYFNRAGVSQSITFEQLSPFDPTIMTVSLFHLGKNATTLQVRDYPVPMQVFWNDHLCSPNSIGQIWNPVGIQSSGVTHDLRAIGDLSGKFGSLAGKTSYTVRLTDYNLPMFGRNSIIGHSVVVNTQPNWVCGTILEERVTVAVATFYFPVIGQVMFSQSAENPDSDTWIYGELNFGDERMNGNVGTMNDAETEEMNGSVGTINDAETEEMNGTVGTMNDTETEKMNGTVGTMNDTETEKMNDPKEIVILRGLRIHNKPAGYDQVWNNLNQFNSTGSIYNPNNTTMLFPEYDDECNFENPLRCCVGDVYRQTNYFTSSNDGRSSKKFIFQARNIPLSGKNSIVGQSLVIIEPMFAGYKIVACANIAQLRPRQSEKNKSIVFSQTYRLIENVVTVSFNITNVHNADYSFYVHTLPIDERSKKSCSVQDSSGYFNPYNVPTRNRPWNYNGTTDEYPVGDLSSKNRYIPTFDRSVFFGKRIDGNLQLFGVNSIIGRSFVVQHFGRSSSWSCGNIQEDVSMTTGRMIAAIATFAPPEYSFSGSIIFTQYVYSDGTMSDTSIYYKLDYTNKDAIKTNNHAVFIGSNQVFGDRTASGLKKCESAGQTFNPYTVSNVKERYDLCGKANQLLCTVGDVSRKIGRFNIGSKTTFGTDMNLPLTGIYSVIGLGIVITQNDNARISFACANIRPLNAEKVTMAFNKPGSLSLIDTRNTFAHGLQIDEWNLGVFPTKQETDGYINIDVYFMGTNASDAKKEFLANNNITILESKSESDKVAVSVRILSLVFICYRLMV